MGHHFAGALAYVDDMVLLSPMHCLCPETTCERFAFSNVLSFNRSKPQSLLQVSLVSLTSPSVTKLCLLSIALSVSREQVDA